MQGTPSLEGREYEVSSTARLLADPGTRIVTVTGLPGVGTTSVARAALARSLTLTTARRTTHPVAAQSFPFLDARRATTPGALTRLLDDAVSAGDVVLVDDVDHSPCAMVEILRFLERQPHTRLLVTARAPLRFPDEFVTRVPALSVQDCELDPRMYAVQPAVRIFLACAARAGWCAHVDESTLKDIAAICQIVGGNPKAIELAAARANCLGTATLLALLRSSTLSRVLGDHPAARDDVVDDHDLFRTIRWSTSLLREGPRTLLACLSVFRSAVPLEAIESVVGTAVDLDDLSDLVDAHLLDPMHLARGSHYVLPPLVREHAMNLLGATPEVAAEVGGRHASWAVDVTSAARNLDHSGAPTAALTLVTSHEPDLVAALSSTSGAEEGHRRALLVLGLAPLWFNRGPTHTELQWVCRVADGAMRAATDVTASDRALLLAWRGAFGMEQARDPEHVQSSLADLQLAHTMASKISGHVRAQVIMLMLRASRAVPDRSAIEPLCRSGYEVVKQSDDQVALTGFEVWSSMLAHQRGDVAQARRWAQLAFERARRVDDPQVLLLASALMRTLPPDTRCGHTQDLEEVPSFQELVEIARRCGDQRTLVWLLPVATVASVHAGNTAAAATFATESLRRAMACGVPLMRSLLSLMGVVVVAAARGDGEMVLHLQQVLRPYRQVLEPSLPPWIGEVYGDQMFGPAGAEPDAPDRPAEGGRVGGHGAAADVRAAADSALAYLRTERAPLLRSTAPPVDLVKDDPRHDAIAPPERLTERERQVLTSLTSGATNKELSRQLGISAKTVMHHTSSIYRKLGVRSRSEAVAWAMRHDVRDTSTNSPASRPSALEVTPQPSWNARELTH